MIDALAQVISGASTWRRAAIDNGVTESGILRALGRYKSKTSGQSSKPY